MNNRVEIPAYTDAWMQGDRYGTILKCVRGADGSLVLSVQLDKSGKIVKVISADTRDI